MPDEVRSKLLKALGYTLRLTDNVESLTAAVEYLRQAAVLNPKKAGVTRDIELLQRALKKSGQPADGDGADGKPEANSTETQTATPPAQPKAKRETKSPPLKASRQRRKEPRQPARRRRHNRTCPRAPRRHGRRKQATPRLRPAVHRLTYTE
ncbi:hypothetical protein [Escherichia coli]|uniref:hypothetical protein n=1 Tax=Escherichia coli TaxID=562 RepID=UPI001FD9C073|nr:hypothetical protein [Escherichia coli]